MDGKEILELLDSDTEALWDGYYLCLIKDEGWPFFQQLERFLNKWVIDDENGEEWNIIAWVRLPDTDETVNYIKNINAAAATAQHSNDDKK